MTIKNLTTLVSDMNLLLADNTTGAISASDIRSSMTDVVDSLNALHANTIVYVKTKSDFGTIAGNQVEPDPTKSYFIDGLMDGEGLEIIVGPSGLNVYSDDFNNKGLTNVKFITKSASYAGNIYLKSLTISPQTGQNLFELDNNSNFGSFELISVNVGQSGTTHSFGYLSNYRQFFATGCAFFNYSNGFTFNGSWSGITIRDSISLFGGSTSILCKTGTTFTTGNFRCSINFSSGAMNVDAVLADFSESNISNYAGAQLTEISALNNSNIMPNLSHVSIKAYYKGNVNLQKTSIGGKIRFDLNTETVISNDNEETKALGTTTSSLLEHFEEDGNNRLVYKGAQRRDFQVNGIIFLLGGNNDVVRVILKHYNSSGVLQSSGDKTIQALDGNVVQNLAQSAPIFSSFSLNQDDYIELHIANENDQSNITVTADSYFKIYEA